MRLLLVMAVAGLLQAAEWTGTIEVVETLAGSGIAKDRSVEAEALATGLEGRLSALREALRTAGSVEARILRQDVGRLEAELEALAIDRGQTVTLSRTMYYLAGNRIVVDSDEARIVADRATGNASVATGGKLVTERLAPIPDPAEPTDAKQTEAFQDLATRTGTLTVEGDPVRVVWVPDLPNVYALSRLGSQSRSPLQAALATLPGLPIVVERRRKGGVLRLKAQRVVPGPIEDRLLAD